MNLTKAQTALLLEADLLGPISDFAISVKYTIPMRLVRVHRERINSEQGDTGIAQARRRLLARDAARMLLHIH